MVPFFVAIPHLHLANRCARACMRFVSSGLFVRYHCGLCPSIGTGAGSGTGRAIATRRGRATRTTTMMTRFGLTWVAVCPAATG